MPVLNPNEYDISYFDGKKTTYQHNAGYSKYERWQRKNDDFLPTDQSTGEYWKDLALRYNLDHSLQNKKILEIGCAKGFIIEALRDLGLEAYGLDVSSYAVNCARDDIKPFLTVGDARTYLTNYKKFEFDIVFSRRTLSCFTDAELNIIVPELNRISKSQFHSIWPEDNSEYYNVKTVQQTIDQFPWKVGTVFFESNNLDIVYKK